MEEWKGRGSHGSLKQYVVAEIYISLSYINISRNRNSKSFAKREEKGGKKENGIGWNAVGRGRGGKRARV